MSLRGTRNLVLVNTSVGAFIGPFTSSAISFSTPEIGQTFHATFYEIIWLPLGFLMSLSSFYLISGRLADEYGRVRLYRLGLILFSLGILTGTLSPGISILLISVFIAGIGAAFAGSNSTAIIGQTFNRGVRGRALGINVMSVYLGLTLAPSISGIIIKFVGWRMLLAVSGPVALFALALTFIAMAGMDVRGGAEKIDSFGAITLASGIFLTVFYLSLGNVYGWINTSPILIAGIVSFSLFIMIERKVPNPLISAKLFLKNRTFTASNLTAFLNYLSTFSLVFVFAIYLQLVLHIGPLASGLIIAVEPIFMVILSPISGMMSDKFGSRIVASVGMLLIGFSFLVLYFFALKSTVGIIISLAVIGTGFGLFSAANTNSVMGSVSDQQFGLASGTLGTMRYSGQLLSITLSSIILTSVLPRTAVIGMFSGIPLSYATSYGYEFVHGLMYIMLVSGLISFVGAYTSLLKNRGA